MYWTGLASGLLSLAGLQWVANSIGLPGLGHAGVLVSGFGIVLLHSWIEAREERDLYTWALKESPQHEASDNFLAPWKYLYDTPETMRVPQEAVSALPFAMAVAGLISPTPEGLAIMVISVALVLALIVSRHEWAKTLGSGFRVLLLAFVLMGVIAPAIRMQPDLLPVMLYLMQAFVWIALFSIFLAIMLVGRVMAVVVFLTIMALRLLPVHIQRRRAEFKTRNTLQMLNIHLYDRVILLAFGAPVLGPAIMALAGSFSPLGIFLIFNCLLILPLGLGLLMAFRSNLVTSVDLGLLRRVIGHYSVAAVLLVNLLLVFGYCVGWAWSVLFFALFPVTEPAGLIEMLMANAAATPASLPFAEQMLAGAVFCGIILSTAWIYTVVDRRAWAEVLMVIGVALVAATLPWIAPKVQQHLNPIVDYARGLGVPYADLLPPLLLSMLIPLVRKLLASEAQILGSTLARPHNCTSCGKASVDDNSRFCSGCGAVLDQTPVKKE
jgi:hypothetical protein